MSGLQQPINLAIPSIQCIPTTWVIFSRFPILEFFIQLNFILVLTNIKVIKRSKKFLHHSKQIYFNWHGTRNRFVCTNRDVDYIAQGLNHSKKF